LKMIKNLQKLPKTRKKMAQISYDFHK
jgi:hypothetical protein